MSDQSPIRRDSNGAPPSKDSPSTHTVVSSGAKLNIEVLGEGEPVVFLHAAVADSRMWLDQMVAISPKRKAIAYDRRGFGETTAEPEDYSSITDLMAVLDTLSAGEKAVLVGCSQGGRIALDAALAHPDRVSGIVLIAPTVSGVSEPDMSETIRRLLAEQNEAVQAHDIDRIQAIKAHLWLDGPLEIEGRITGKARELLLDMNAIALSAAPVGTDVDIAGLSPAFERLSEIKVPCLMIWGELDFPHIKERCRMVANKIAICASVELSNSAHLPSLDKSEELTTSIVEFIS